MKREFWWLRGAVVEVEIGFEMCNGNCVGPHDLRSFPASEGWETVAERHWEHGFTVLRVVA